MEAELAINNAKVVAEGGGTVDEPQGFRPQFCPGGSAHSRPVSLETALWASVGRPKMRPVPGLFWLMIHRARSSFVARIGNPQRFSVRSTLGMALCVEDNLGNGK
jgi:hypothetical protein